MNKLILASSSTHRRLLLERLQIPFVCISPDVDESPLDNEAPVELVKRLSITKAKKVATTNRNSLIIGADQIALLDNQVLTKPGNAETATRQLRIQSGKTVSFFSGLSVYNSATDNYEVDVISTEVTFRKLSEGDIRRYLAIDEPFSCAGSFKSESLGISLFSEVISADPTALIGLPLIRLCEMLRAQGMSV